MTRADLERLIGEIRRLRVGIVGDFCLDAYLLLDPDVSEQSLETGLATHPVRSQRYSPGGAGNVACNLQAMGAGSIALFGVTGADPFGDELRRMLDSPVMDTTGLLVQAEGWDTHVYMKPFETEQEQRRLDFGTFNTLLPATLEHLVEMIAGALPSLDVVILKQQVARGVHTGEMRTALRSLAGSHPGTMFIADSRHYQDDYGSACRRLGIRESAALAAGMPGSTLEPDTARVEEICRTLFRRWDAPVFVTLRGQGCGVCDAGGFRCIPGLLLLSPVDTVGAGDSMLSGIAAAMASGEPPEVAAEFGSIVAGVTVQKIMQTGTATPEEILRFGPEADRVYRPDVARSTEGAVYIAGTDIEVVSEVPRGKKFTHIIFDHDGTLSTLRQGWEGIMEPMMVRSILGEGEPPEGLGDQVVAAVREFIDRTTGIQTLVQMQGLVQLVRRFRCVPPGEILDASGYKSLYNTELLSMVEKRKASIARGDLGAADFTIVNALQFVQSLAGRGAVLYLASGTDQEDLEKESAILGYGALFGGRIYGAVGDVTKEAKRLVLERIFSDIGEGAPSRTLAFGDGPVEIRETHKKGGYAVGVASDEIRRSGLNTGKRRRLIEAGADLVAGDYAEMEALLALLFGP